MEKNFSNPIFNFFKDNKETKEVENHENTKNIEEEVKKTFDEEIISEINKGGGIHFESLVKKLEQKNEEEKKEIEQKIKEYFSKKYPKITDFLSKTYVFDKNDHSLEKSDFENIKNIAEFFYKIDLPFFDQVELENFKNKLDEAWQELLKKSRE
jgi:hypothetical protein